MLAKEKKKTKKCGQQSVWRSSIEKGKTLIEMTEKELCTHKRIQFDWNCQRCDNTQWMCLLNDRHTFSSQIFIVILIYLLISLPLSCPLQQKSDGFKWICCRNGIYCPHLLLRLLINGRCKGSFLINQLSWNVFHLRIVSFHHNSIEYFYDIRSVERR